MRETVEPTDAFQGKLELTGPNLFYTETGPEQNHRTLISLKVDIYECNTNQNFVSCLV